MALGLRMVLPHVLRMEDLFVPGCWVTGLPRNGCHAGQGLRVAPAAGRGGVCLPTSPEAAHSELVQHHERGGERHQARRLGAQHVGPE